MQTPDEYGSLITPDDSSDLSALANQDRIAQPRIDPDNPPWGLGMAFVVWVLTFLLLAIVPLAFLIPYAARHGISPASPDYAKALAEFALSDPNALFVQVLATLPTHLLTFFIVWAVVTRFGKRPFWETIGWSWGRHFGLWSSIAVGVTLFFASSAVAHFMGGDKPTQLDQILSSSPASKYLIVILATFTAPFAEEFIYRGLLYSALARLIGKWVAVTLVVTLFTLVHVPQYSTNYGVIAAVGLLSVALTVVRAVSGRLLPCYIIHLVFNGIQSILILAGFSGPRPKITPDQVAALVLPLVQLVHSLI